MLACISLLSFFYSCSGSHIGETLWVYLLEFLETQSHSNLPIPLALTNCSPLCLQWSIQSDLCGSVEWPGSTKTGLPVLFSSQICFYVKDNAEAAVLASCYLQVSSKHTGCLACPTSWSQFSFCKIEVKQTCFTGLCLPRFGWVLESLNT